MGATDHNLTTMAANDHNLQTSAGLGLGVMM